MTEAKEKPVDIDDTPIGALTETQLASITGMTELRASLSAFWSGLPPSEPGFTAENIAEMLKGN